MKTIKILIIILLSVFSINLKAQDTIPKVNSSLVYNDIKNAVATNSPKIEKAIGVLAKDLNVTAHNLWDILVRQQKVYSICFLLLTISALTNWYLFYKKNINKDNIKYERVPDTDRRWVLREGVSPNKESKENRYDYEWRNFPTEKLVLAPSGNISWFKYIHLIICITLSIFSYIHFSQMLTGFINPEFGAMQTIAEVASKLK